MTWSTLRALTKSDDLALAKGVTLVAASAPTHFVEDTPTAILVRQVFRAIAEFEKATTVAKLAAARCAVAAYETKLRLIRILLRSETRHIEVRPSLYGVNQTKSFGDMSMLGSPNLHRGNVPLAMRLKIHDLHAQLAPLERYGVGGMSLAITGGIRALVRFVGSALRGAFSCGAVTGGNAEAV